MRICLKSENYVKLSSNLKENTKWSWIDYSGH